MKAKTTLECAPDNNPTIKVGLELMVSSRHCGFCLKVCGSPPKLCGGCKKRAYCSKECQAADWSRKGDGQRHVNWCRRYEYGEEDVDWEVVSIPNKGLGVRAKKLLPEGYRIIVEPVFTEPHGHLGINDLEPKEGSLQAKFKLNQLPNYWACRDNGASYVGLRISRVNHSCRPNAARIYDETARVEILYALRDIQPGEEVCFSYDLFPDVFLFHCCTELQTLEEKFAAYWHRLYVNWGIKCSGDCFCMEAKTRELIMEAGSLFATMFALVPKCKTAEAIAVGEKLRPIQRHLNVSWNQRAKLDHYLYRLAIWSKKTLAKSDQFIRSELNIFRNITPYSENVKKTEWMMDRPEQHSEYLKMDTDINFVTNYVMNDSLLVQRL